MNPVKNEIIHSFMDKLVLDIQVEIFDLTG